MQRDHARRTFLSMVAGTFFLTAICFAAEECRLDDEEYAVYSTLLFPKASGGNRVSASDSADRLSPPRNLAGVTPGPYAVFSSTMTLLVKVADGKDADLLEDFNRKNAQACPLDGNRLAAALTEADRGQVHLTASADSKRPQGGVAKGFVRLSRVGFNRPKTVAVVEIHAIYDPEAGIGYRAFLQKSSPEAPWRLQDILKTRQF